MIYCYPRLSEQDLFFFRLLGPGLGNLLFPWARAVVYAKKNGLTLINPTWPQIKLGTLVRRERDSRMYSDLFEHNPNALSGWRKVKTLLTSIKQDEQSASLSLDNSVIEFSGMEGMFSSILESHALVKSELVEIVRPIHKRALSCNFDATVSMHIRMGDFAVPKSDAEIQSGKNNIRIPLQWYIDMLTKIRQQVGRKVPCHIFSDGSDEDLSELLQLEGTTRQSFGSAIGDMLALSRANLLICSGSTFSMWASYLGRMPTIWHPGQRKQVLYGTSNVPELEMSKDSDFSVIAQYL